MLRGGLLDFHAALVGSHEGHPGACPIQDHSKVQLLGDIQALFDIDFPNLLSVGAGLGGSQGHPQNLLRQVLRFRGGPGELHSTRLAPSAGVDLRLDYGDRRPKLSRRPLRFPGGARQNPAGNRDSIFLQDLLRLKLVDLHLPYTPAPALG